MCMCACVCAAGNVGMCGVGYSRCQWMGNNRVHKHGTMTTWVVVWQQ